MCASLSKKYMGNEQNLPGTWYVEIDQDLTISRALIF